MAKEHERKTGQVSPSTPEASGPRPGSRSDPDRSQWVTTIPGGVRARRRNLVVVFTGVLVILGAIVTAVHRLGSSR